MTTSTTSTEICCPEFQPSRLDGITHDWKEKLFISESVPELMHIPLPGSFAHAVNKLMSLAGPAGTRDENPLLLCYDTSPWKSILLLSVNKPIEGAHMVKLSGRFLSKVFEGPFRNIPDFIRQMDAWLKERGQMARQYYFHYPYCPKCAEKYGHNYIVIFAELK